MKKFHFCVFDSKSYKTNWECSKQEQIHVCVFILIRGLPNYSDQYECDTVEPRYKAVGYNKTRL